MVTDNWGCSSLSLENICHREEKVALLALMDKESLFNKAMMCSSCHNMVALSSILFGSIHRSFLERLLLILWLPQVVFLLFDLLSGCGCQILNCSALLPITCQAACHWPSLFCHPCFRTSCTTPLPCDRGIAFLCVSWMIKLGLNDCIKCLFMN